MKEMFLALLNALAPVLIPLLTSGIVWLLNQKDRLIAPWPNWAKQLVVMALATALAAGGQALGIDVTTPEGVAVGLVALGIFQLGKGTATT